ncbi:Chromosome segregation protein Spc25 [Trinorchestia longiramus]|nr:Chromosome segregation protein Spc25 [Trinorchestia longiramus]
MRNNYVDRKGQISLVDSKTGVKERRPPNFKFEILAMGNPAKFAKKTDGASVQYSVDSVGFCQDVELNKQALLNLKSVASCRLLELSQELAVSEKKCRDDVAVLQSNIERLRAERSSVQGNQHKCEQELAALSAKLASLQTLLLEKKKERDAEEQCLNGVQREVNAKQNILDEIIAQNENGVAVAGRGVSLYEKHLGLNIRKLSTSNTTVFSFTQVQRADPLRVFEVAVTLNGDQYELASDPPLADLPTLQRRLNHTNNLAGFLIHARKAFKKLD